MTTKSPKPKKRLPTDHFYVIRACQPNHTSHGNFEWPLVGRVEAPRFIRDGKCGNGLHGWFSLEYIGDEGSPNWFSSDLIGTYVWLIVKVPRYYRGRLNYQKIGHNKVKFGHGVVIDYFNREPLGAVRAFASLTKRTRQP